MSFILDALRKSEHDRRSDAVPSISRVPSAVAKHKLPIWAVAVMLVLCASVLAMGWAWWRSAQPLEPPTAERELPLPQALDTRPAPAVRRPARSLRDLTIPEPTVRDPAPREAATVEAGASAGPAQDAPPDVAAPPASQASPNTLPLATMGELTAQGVSVPSLTLELHVFSDNPEQRFVFVNARRYQEGDTLREGPHIVEITVDGVVLDQGGRRFLLPRN